MNLTDANGNTPLHIAAMGGHISIVLLLIKHGVFNSLSFFEIKLKKPNLEFFYIFFFEISKLVFFFPTHVDEIVYTTYMRSGANVNEYNGLNETPLHHSMTAGHWGVTYYLLSAGANVEAPTADGMVRHLLTFRNCEFIFIYYNANIIT